MGWTNPWVAGGLLGGVVLLGVCCVVETRVAEPMFAMSLFKIRAFWAGISPACWRRSRAAACSSCRSSGCRGSGLPLHGYDFADTPLWARIYLLPLTIAFLIVAPLCGSPSDRFGARTFATGGLLVTAASFVGFMLLPVDFNYWAFAALLVLNGICSGMFSAPNTTAIMNSVPAAQRGAASGMRATFFNSGTSLSIGVFFSLMIAGLAANLPATLYSGLTAHGMAGDVATGVANQPPVGSRFAAFLGENPIQHLVGTDALGSLSTANRATLTGHQSFPDLISGPFHDGLVIVFGMASVMSIIGAVASLARGTRYVHVDTPAQGSAAPVRA